MLTCTGPGRPDSAFEKLIAGQREPMPHAELGHDDLLTIMFTSGTTGHPKGAMITHGMSFWNAVNLGGPAHVTSDTCHLAVLPLFHTGGLNCYANVAFHAEAAMGWIAQGATIVGGCCRPTGAMATSPPRPEAASRGAGREAQWPGSIGAWRQRQRRGWVLG